MNALDRSEFGIKGKGTKSSPLEIDQKNPALNQLARSAEKGVQEHLLLGDDEAIITPYIIFGGTYFSVGDGESNTKNKTLPYINPRLNFALPLAGESSKTAIQTIWDGGLENPQLLNKDQNVPISIDGNATLDLVIPMGKNRLHLGGTATLSYHAGGERFVKTIPLGVPTKEASRSRAYSPYITYSLGGNRYTVRTKSLQASLIPEQSDITFAYHRFDAREGSNLFNQIFGLPIYNYEVFANEGEALSLSVDFVERISKTNPKKRLLAKAYLLIPIHEDDLEDQLFQQEDWMLSDQRDLEPIAVNQEGSAGALLLLQLNKVGFGVSASVSGPNKAQYKKYQEVDQDHFNEIGREVKPFNLRSSIRSSTALGFHVRLKM